MGQMTLAVVTDVDGCVIDHATYSHAATDAALSRLQQAHVPVVLCSSKTRAELERLQQELGLSDPFISENGGAVFSALGTFPFPLPGAIRRAAYEVVELARPHDQVVAILNQVAEREALPVTTFSSLSVQEVADDCGLSLPEARLAKLREYDEPFRLATPDPAARARLSRALRSAGLRCLTGGRYDHAVSGTDKGTAVALLRRCYARARGEMTMIGLGDAINDVELLKAVDIPIVVRGPDAAMTAAVADQVRGARVTSAIGPAGWSEAIMALLDERMAPSM